jgi:hypothetical protein
MSSRPAAFSRVPRRPALLLALPAVLIACASGIVLLGRQTESGSGTVKAQPAALDLAKLDQAAFEQRAGVRLVRVSATAAGGLVDVRYQVVDEEAALSIHDSGRTPALVDERTGRTFDDEWMGHLMHPTLRLGRTYYLLLLNPGGELKSGSGVTVTMGGAILEHVLVR